MGMKDLAIQGYILHNPAQMFSGLSFWCIVNIKMEGWK
jgi:hypothetical protein